MIYYITAIFFFLISIISIYIKKKDNKFKNIIFFIISLYLVIFAAIRENIGLDYTGYIRIFNVIDVYKTHINIYSLYKLADVEPLFMLLNYIMPSFRSLLYVSAFIGVGIKCYLIWREMEYRYVGLFFYFCYTFLVMDMGIMRQGLATSILLIGIFALKDDKNIQFFICCVISILIHSTSLLVLPLFFWVKKCNNNCIKGLITAISFAFSLFEGYFINILNLITNRLNIYILKVRVDAYSNRYDSTGWSTIVKWILFFVIFFLVYKYLKITDKDSLFVLDVYWYGMVILFITRTFSIVSQRGTLVFFFMIPFVVDGIIRNNKRKNIAAVILLLFAIYFFYQLILVLPGSEGNKFQGYVPYNWYFK